MTGRPASRDSAAHSTSWGGRGRTTAASTSWGGRRLSRLAAGAVTAVTAFVPMAAAVPASAATETYVIGGPGAADAVAAVRGGHVRTHGLDSVAVAELSPAQAKRLRAAGLAVELDAPVHLDSDGDEGADGRPAGVAAAEQPGRLSVRELTRADRTGLTGAGVTVAVIDSGVDEVPALAGRVIRGVDLTGTGQRDSHGHGTFVAGLIAGDGTAADGSRTGYVGVAPKARIVSIKIAGRNGRSSVGQLTKGVAWAIKNRARYGIDVINLSLSSAKSASFDASPLNAAVEAAWFSGMTVVTSAGNDGARRITTAPANDPWVLTVGSVDDRNTVNPGDDRRSPFSNRGRTLDGFVKPEVSAFGQHVRSTLPAGSDLAGRQKLTGLPAGYGQMSGTSMATAVASGVAALLEQAHPRITPNQVKGAVVGSRRGGAKVVDALSAVRSGTSRRANVGLRPSVALAMVYAAEIAQADPATVDWSSVIWTEVTWTDATWTSATWTNATWTNATWTSAAWTSSAWADATWTSATWADATWTSATWADATWTSATWTSATWTQAARAA